MTNLQDLWYCAALSDEVSSIPMRRIICDQPLVMYRTDGGNIVALEDRCGHRQAPLSKGRVLGDEIQCMYHGYTFGPDGMCRHVPHQDNAPRSANIQSYAIAERWGYIWLWWGDPKNADLDRIPSLRWNEDPNRRPVYFHFYVKANFQLMADNLLDVSHTDFLHRATIGSQSGMKTDAPKVELTRRVEDGHVYCTRKLSNALLGGVATKWAGSNLPVTRTNTQMWEPPNTIHSVLEFENEEIHRTVHMEHIMTPETATTTHYFMNWTRDFGLDGVDYPTNEDVRREQLQVVTTEDIPMVEAQQENLLHFVEATDVAAKQDVFIIDVHRVLTQAHAAAGNPLPPELTRVGRRLQTSELSPSTVAHAAT
jgi:vanillate O-demethylase monooxygenase subunit